ncbi:MAG: hypothetical protein MI921_28230 [Cytophagales bacterium]|nr:hypothetical protein [Cytophagales bacterium]
MNCIYLIQSDSPEIPYEIPANRDVILLQWQKEFVQTDNSFHFPNSTWASGRNELLKRAMEKGHYDYYIFLDDDLRLYFSLETFERLLAANQASRVAPFVQHQWYHCSQNLSEEVKYIDHCFMAIRQDCAKEVLPYSLDPDEVNWWFSSERMCEKFWHIYPYGTIRFNQLVVVNMQHRPYPKNGYQGLPDNITRSNEGYTHPF